MEVYLKIKDEFSVQEWTIISSIEEYPLFIDYGWTWYWIEGVQEKHPDLLKVYMDTPRFTVYHLEQDSLNPYDVTELWR